MYFQNESYIPQLFTRKFSPREPKCLNGLVVWHIEIASTREKTIREIAPIGATELIITAKPKTAEN